MENTLVLKSGEEMQSALVKVIFLSLQSLLDKNPIAFIEIVSLARNPGHQLFGNTGEILQRLNLVEPNMKLLDDVRLIVLAASEGEGLNLRLVSPVVENKEPDPREAQRQCSIDDPELFACTHEIMDVIFCEAAKIMSRDGLYFKDRRGNGVNPFYNQTASGFFLELYYGSPTTLWTPWGKMGFTGSTGGRSFSNLVDAILKRFAATEHIPEKTSHMGSFGPVYALHEIDGKPLPKPLELKHESFTSYEEVKEAWSRLTEQRLASQ